MAALTEIFDWFMTGKKPTQAQFWATFSSFRHKAEAIAQSDIANLSNTLNAKAEKSQFDAHLTDPNAHAESIGGKLDKASYPGTAEDLDNRISAIERPDKVLKYGLITITGLTLSIEANAFAWVLSKNQFLNPPAFSSPISTATAGKYRNNIVVGNQFGTYEIVQGNEASTGGAAAEPPVPPGTIKVGYFLVFGSTIADSGNSDDSDPFAGEIRLPAYPNTRNDGQLPTNKILSTDDNGYLKLYTMAVSPAPYLNQLIPDSYFPDTTGNIRILGDFFTPQMCDRINNPNAIILGGVAVIHYATFISSQEILVNVTTGSAEGSFSATLDNGLITTVPNALMIVLGEVIKPTESDYQVLSGNPNISVNSEFRLNVFNVDCQADFFTIPIGQNFRVYTTLTNTPLYSAPYNGGPLSPAISLFSTSDNLERYALKMYLNGVGRDNIPYGYQRSTGFDFTGVGVISNTRTTTIYDEPTIYFERIGTEYRIKWNNDTLVFSDSYNGELKIRVYAKLFDSINLKYVKLA
jgi:hypothetical protein